MAYCESSIQDFHLRIVVMCCFGLLVASCDAGTTVSGTVYECREGDKVHSEILLDDNPSSPALRELPLSGAEVVFQRGEVIKSVTSRSDGSFGGSFVTAPTSLPVLVTCSKPGYESVSRKLEARRTVAFKLKVILTRAESVTGQMAPGQ